jgi:hypothetical protein
MSLSLIAAVVMVVGWAALVFVAQVPSGWVHLLYVGAVLLFARRILLGAPKFLS